MSNCENSNEKFVFSSEQFLFQNQKYRFFLLGIEYKNNLGGCAELFDFFSSIYIKLKVCLSVCLSAIERKLETFRYKQTYESYITFSREAKYGILISIRIVFGGLRAYIYSTVAKCATNNCHKITYFIFVNFVLIVIAFQ